MREQCLRGGTLQDRVYAVVYFRATVDVKHVVPTLEKLCKQMIFVILEHLKPLLVTCGVCL